MSDTVLDELFENADDELFKNVTLQPGAPIITPEEVAAVFSTPAGRKVLSAMHRMWVNVTIVEPGQAPEVHGIRQGQANVVFWIADQISAAHQVEEPKQ